MKEPDAEIEVEAEAVRAYFDGEVLPDELETALDTAQAQVFIGAATEYTILVTIKK